MKKNFGLIGKHLSHSFSKDYFENKFNLENIQNCQFDLFELDDINKLSILLKNNNLFGLAVTIPYKKLVIPFLEHSNELVKTIGACNCIKIKDESLLGFNTDCLGFEISFSKYLKKNHNNALILGTGGASLAVEFSLKRLGLSYKFVSRSPKDDNFGYNQLTKEVLENYSVIINTTPLGTFPNIEEKPPIPYNFISDKHYLFDLIYNPTLTRFLQLGKDAGALTLNGFEMLALQAELNWKIWNNSDIV